MIIGNGKLWANLPRREARLLLRLVEKRAFWKRAQWALGFVKLKWIVEGRLEKLDAKIEVFRTIGKAIVMDHEFMRTLVQILRETYGLDFASLDHQHPMLIADLLHRELVTRQPSRNASAPPRLVPTSDARNGISSLAASIAEAVNRSST